MNIEKYLSKVFCTTTESMLFDRIHLANTIESYDRGEFNVEHGDVFESCVQQIVSGKFNRYNFDDDDVKTMFGFRSPAKCRLYLHLMSYEAGKRLSAVSDKHRLQELDDLGDNMDYGFYLSYTLSEQKIGKLINGLSSAAILKETRSSAGYRNEVYNLCDKDIKPGMSDEDMIALIDPYNDGAYVELPEYVQLLSHILLRDELYEQWVSMLVKLKYFPQQGAMIRNLRTIAAFLEVLQELKRPNVTHRNVILHLMRDQFFRIVSEQPKTLEQSKIFLSENRGKRYAEMCSRYLSEWNDNIEETTTDVFTYLAEQLKLSDCSEWFSRKQAQYADGDSRFVAFEQKAISMIGHAIEELARPNKWKVADADINTLFFYIRQTENRKITVYRSKQLMEAVFNRLYAENCYYQIRLNSDTMELFRLAYRSLSDAVLNPFEMILPYNRFLDGYLYDFKKCAQIARGDSFWFSMLLLGAGDSENISLFDNYLDLLFHRLAGQASNEKDYFLPLYVAEMVVTQALKSEKNKFESFIIENIPHLGMVLTILSANNGIMDKPIKEMLLSRIYSEWATEEQLMKRDKDPNLEIINKYIQKLRNDKQTS